jgi:hypothetical protein
MAPNARPPRIAPGIHQPFECASTLAGVATAVTAIVAAAASAMMVFFMKPPPDPKAVVTNANVSIQGGFDLHQAARSRFVDSLLILEATPCA